MFLTFTDSPEKKNVKRHIQKCSRLVLELYLNYTEKFMKIDFSGRL